MIEVEDDILTEVIGCKEYHKSAPQFGDRAWIAEGEKLEVIYWDQGNGWCEIMLVIPKGCESCKKELVEFYKKLRVTIAERYDDDMCRID